MTKDNEEFIILTMLKLKFINEPINRKKYTMGPQNIKITLLQMIFFIQ